MEMKNCTAGFARLDITPPLGVSMIGAGPRRAKGVLDPLYVNAVAFGQGDKSAVLLVCDLLGLYGSCGDEWPGQIAERVGLRADSVILCCTHTHTGPSAGSDPMYFDWLLRRLCDAATIALNDRRPVTDVCHAEGIAPGLTHVRRYLTKDGDVVSFPKCCDPILVGPASQPDESMRLVRILRQDAPEIVLVNFQSHPDNVGGEYYSADYPGALRDRVEAVRSGVHCVFLDGAEGQMVKNDRMQPHIPKSHENAVGYGVKLADVALDLFDRTVSTDMAGLAYGQTVKQLDVNPNSDPNHVETGNPETIPAIVSTIAFCGLALLGLPGEPFCEVGQHIRASSKYPVTCVLCQANGAHGYFPLAENYDEPGGSYEPRVSHVRKGSAEELMEVADELVAAL